MKRSVEGGESESKQAKIDDEVTAIQDKLSALDAECREEQVKIQCKYDKDKKPLFDKRGDLLKKIPKFWKTVFVNFAGPSGLILTPELPLLDHLADVRLVDNLDTKGSHKFTFTFSENPFFKETEIVKEITVAEDDSVEVKVTPITWTNNFMDGFPSEEGDVTSFVKWLQSKDEDREGDFGSVFRENVWQDALTIHDNPPQMDDDYDEEGEEGEEIEGEEEGGEEAGEEEEDEE